MVAIAENTTWCGRLPPLILIPHEQWIYESSVRKITVRPFGRRAPSHRLGARAGCILGCS
jgi:hypothetical protein